MSTSQQANRSTSEKIARFGVEGQVGSQTNGKT